MTTTTQTIIAISPGPIKSTIIEWDGKKINSDFTIENNLVIEHLVNCFDNWNSKLPIYCEMPADYDGGIMMEDLETYLFIGNIQMLAQREGVPFHKVYWKDVAQYFGCQRHVRDEVIIKAACSKVNSTPKELRRALAVALFSYEGMVAESHPICRKSDPLF